MSGATCEELAGSIAAKAIELDGASGTAQSALVSSIARGQLARQLADDGFHVTLFELEHYRYRLLHQWLGDVDRLALCCQSDPPEGSRYDLVVLTLRRDAGTELTRDLIQKFAAAVNPEGHLVVVIDHPDDQWVGDHLRDISKTVRRFRHDEGATGYFVSANTISLRPRDFDCRFAFRHQGKLLQAVSRPGVFAHRKLDLGARRLIDAMKIEPGQQVLDIGCGSGTVSFAAASVSPDVRVTAIDSNTRAVECTIRGAILNGLDSQIKVVLSSDGSASSLVSGSINDDDQLFDVALANPPYFANFQIAELFLEAAYKSLRPGGRVWMVAKQPDWYDANVPRFFDRVKVTSVGGGYCIACGIRPTGSTI